MLQNGLRLHSVQQVAQARLANSRRAPRHALLLPFAKLTRVTPSQGPKMQPLNDQEGQNSVAFTLLDSFSCKASVCKAASKQAPLERNRNHKFELTIITTVNFKFGSRLLYMLQKMPLTKNHPLLLARFAAAVDTAAGCCLLLLRHVYTTRALRWK